MRVLVTGVSGFLGPHLVRNLEDAGHRVWGTCRRGDPEEGGEGIFTVDLESPDDLERAVRGSRPEVIVHLAGRSHVGTSWDEMGSYFRVNVLGTENLLKAAPGIPTVLASSGEIYGVVPEEEQPIAEDRPPDPPSPYALTKGAAERLVLGAGGVVARCFNFVGPGQSPEFALPSFARQLAAIEAGTQEPTLRVGNLEARRDFVPVQDGAEGFRILVEEGAPGTTYQIATGRARSIRQVLDRLIQQTGLEVEIEIDRKRLRPVDVPLLRGSAERLRALGWRPRRSLDGVLAELWSEARRE
ncbi:MAG: GDP-mannose 4,6-dehydratase [Thermoanaerobaculia bacterium]|nr:GDP-mannose 4,6-dehydratase [Thermoanaerobaculia bacterium]